MTRQPFYHSFLRPCVLQILRAQGYHAARPSVVDTLTDMAARYLTALCEATAMHAAHNSTLATGLAPSVVDVRMALEDCGALVATPAPALDGRPPDVPAAWPWPADEEAGVHGVHSHGSGHSDTRSVDEFIEWVCGPRAREIRRVALDGSDLDDPSLTDYLAVLKKKHSKTGEDAKYSGTVLGRTTGATHDHHHAAAAGGVAAGSASANNDVVVEGGDCPSILSWQEQRIAARQQPPPPTPPPDDEADEEMDDDDDNGDGAGDEKGKGTSARRNRSPSSGLSSLGDRSLDEDMEREFAGGWKGGGAAADTSAPAS